MDKSIGPGLIFSVFGFLAMSMLAWQLVRRAYEKIREFIVLINKGGVTKERVYEVIRFAIMSPIKTLKIVAVALVAVIADVYAFSYLFIVIIYSKLI